MGAETFREFLSLYGAKFRTPAETRTAYDMYVKARYAKGQIAIGRLSHMDNLGEEYVVLRLPDSEWTQAINDAFVQGAIDRGAIDLRFLTAESVGEDVPGQLADLEDLSLVAARYPEHPIPRINRARVLENLARYEEARSDLDCAVELDPEDPVAHHFRAEFLERQGLNEEALESRSRVVELMVGNPEPLLKRAPLLFHLGRYEQAGADLDRAVELDPMNPGGYFTRAVFFQKLGRFEQAQRDLNRVLELGAEGEAALNTLTLLARISGLLGDAGSAIVHLRRLMQLAPDIKEQDLKHDLGRISDFDPIRDDPEFVAFVASLRISEL